MYIPFEEMPGQARVWIYQANRPLSQAEEDYALQTSQVFMSRWAAHGKDLKSSVKIFHHQFLVIAVDETYNQASGCSIDASVALVKELEQKFSNAQHSFSFFDRTKVAFVYDDQVFLESTKSLKERIAEGNIKPDTLTFNNLVNNKDQFEKEWVVPAKDSWLARYF